MVIETKHAFLRNLNTTWLEAGKGKPQIILFLHGYPDNPRVWSEQIKYFSAKYHVVCPYARGTFASEPGEDLQRFSSQSICLDLLEILKIVDPKNKKKVTVVGHDLGGAIAWRLATYLGPKLSQLIIINSLSIEQMASRLKSRPRQWFNSWYIFPFLIPNVSEKWVGKFSKRLLPWAYRLGGLTTKKFPKIDSNYPFPVATLRQYRAFAKEALSSLRQPSPRIKTPTLVIWGNSDPFLLAPTLDEIEPYAEKLTIRILQGGHWIFRECPEVVNPLIENFCQLGESHAGTTEKTF
ncbi:MAG: alpha/beta hydrolase [Deltaproteobacteria bacterium]|nr:alpha/beta hydrolase [Deltaproteobacteria bacterium]